MFFTIHLSAIPAVFVVLLSIISSVSAGPLIEFDNTTYSCGIIPEEKADKRDAVFIVHNTGNALFKLTDKHPGCDCTVVKYDLLIAPGKSSKIESAVNIRGYKSGDISKTITASSNAEDNPTVW